MNYLTSIEMDKPHYYHEKNKSIKILILITYSAFYLDLAIREADVQKREDLFSKVMAHVNRADKIHIEDNISFVLKGMPIRFDPSFNTYSRCLGFLLFFQGNFDQSENYFDNARDLSPSSIPAYLGKVCIISPD